MERETHHRFNPIRTVVAVVAIGVSTISAPAVADGYYGRIGAAVERPPDTVFDDIDCSSASPAALYGCGSGGDGATRRTRGGFGTALALEAALGYEVSPAARVEVEIGHRPRLEFSGDANFLAPERQQSVVADVSVVSAMVAAYIDLPGWGVPKLGPFEPFLGMGGGVARNRVGESRMTFPRTTTVVPGGHRTGFAWMATAGVSAALGNRTAIDVAWRYTDLGEARTGQGVGRVIWRDGSRDDLLLDLAETEAHLQSHGLVVSVRRYF